VPGHVRVDTGVRQGDTITPNYDPMIAKLIVWGEDRPAAVRRLAAALTEYEVVGPQTNLDLLRAIAGHPAFAAAELDTGFIPRHADSLMPVVPAAEADEAVIWAVGALAALREQQEEVAAQVQDLGDRWSPWAQADAWRMNGEGYQDLHFRRGEDDPVTIRAHPLGTGRFRLDLPGGTAEAELAEDDAGLLLLLDGVSRRLRLVRRAEELTVVLAGRNHLLRRIDPLAPPRT
jgi:3-methylcrotonyl-CoA carboxylase alpha subunit